VPQSKIGHGSITFKLKNKTIRITNLLGNTVDVHDIQDNPFVVFDKFLKTSKSDIHIVDFHTETTSEKNAFLLTFAGRVTAILGTHTHVQTADEKIYNGTAYITDTGMTGGSLGVIGAKPDTILEVFKQNAERFRLEPSNTPYQFNAVLFTVDDKAFRPTNIQRIYLWQK
jgi:metallophosphoesterase (TIGR00282 family)